MKNIELNQLKNYLGTGLEFQLQGDWHEECYDLEDCDGFQEAFSDGSIWKLEGYTDVSIPAGEGDLEGIIIQHKSGIYMSDNCIVKPLMYRLSDLDKMIPELGFVPLHKLLEEYCFDLTKMDNSEILSYKESMVEVDMSFQVASMLCNWHFWVFDQSYFEEKLIIDKLTLK